MTKQDNINNFTYLGGHNMLKEYMKTAADSQIIELNKYKMPIRSKDPFWACKWIWPGQTNVTENHWVNVRRTFHLSEINTTAIIYISIDTDYCLWVNGRFVDLGQFSDYPTQKHYDTIPIGKFLRQGSNCVCILGFYQDKNTSRYAKGDAGLIFALHCGNVVIPSDHKCRTRTSLAYVNGPVPLVTKQLGLTIEYDARKNDDWLTIEYEDSHWQQADEISDPVGNFWAELKPRPLPKLVLSPIRANIIQNGHILRNESGGHSVAETMSQDVLIPAVNYERHLGPTDIILYPETNSSDGCFLIADLGREYFGYLELEVSASSGTVIDIAHGEHLIDKRVRCHIGDRNFADRYICSENRQTWLMPVRRLGCRFLQLHFTNTSSPIYLHKVGLLQARYPVEIKGRFECSDIIHNKIYQLCRNTLELCMHEHYEDCPWREQALYSADARNQALCGYYIFGEYDFPEESLRLLGNGIGPDGFLTLCAPTVRDLTIPSFSMIWIVAVMEHCLYSGRKTLCLEFSEQIDFMLRKYLSLCDDKGLMNSPMGDGYWNFYEWTPALNGNSSQGDDYDKSTRKIESCLNLFLLEAFQAATSIFEYIGNIEKNVFYRRQAVQLQNALASEHMPDGLMPTILSPVSPHRVHSQLTESLAMVNNVLKNSFTDTICQTIAHNTKLEQATLSTSLYVYKALLTEKSPCKDFVMKDILKKWGHMLDNGSTTCWETIQGAEDFDGAGSLCHGWSTVPMYIYYAYTLGVKPSRPGFEVFSVNPYLAYFKHAKGVIPTPHGSICVEWDMPKKSFMLKHPDSIKPNLQITEKDWNVRIEAIH